MTKNVTTGVLRILQTLKLDISLQRFLNLARAHLMLPHTYTYEKRQMTYIPVETPPQITQ